jgi:serine/threonine protein phosphatase PrpC
MTHTAPLALSVAAGSDPGLVRQANEDSAYTSHRVFAVADGMGGHAHGEVASSIAIGVITELDEQLPEDLDGVDLPTELAGAVDEIQRRLTERAEQDEELFGMGTTLVALIWDGAEFTAAHIGDSRGYLLRDGRCLQLTRDHTMVQDLLDEGRISAEQAANHPRRSMLTRALQTNGQADPDLFTCEAKPGDRFLLSSDGLTDAAPVQLVAETLAAGAAPEPIVRTLIELAKDHGAPDNVTTVLVHVYEGIEEEPAAPTTFGAAANHAAPA